MTKKRPSPAQQPEAPTVSAEPNGISRRKLLLGSIALVLLTLFVYIPGMQADFIWDDNLLLTQNRLMHDDDGLYKFWFTTRAPDYLPLTWTTLWLEWRCWGQDATGYHVTNIAMHAVAVLLLWMVLGRLRIPGAWLAALIFAIHPVNVASVTWISERKNVLSIIFYLLAIFFYLQFDRRRSVRAYLLSIVMFVLALLSKASVVMLPVVLLLCAWWRRQRLRLRDVAWVIPFLLLAAGISCLTVVQQQTGAIRGEVVRPEGFLSRLAAAGWIPWFYLSKVFFPHKLLMIYPRWDVDETTLISYLPGVVLLGIWVMLWVYRNGWARAPFFMLSYFLAMLFPVLGFFDMAFAMHSLVADHLQYLPIIGPITLTIGLGWSFCKDKARPVRVAGVVAAVVVVCVLSTLAWNQNRRLKNQVTLWEYNLPLNPKAWMGHYNLGTIYAERSRNEQDPEKKARLQQKALEHLTTATRLRPGDSSAHNNCGLLLMQMGQLEEALPYLQKAITLDERSVSAHFNIGLAYKALGRFDEALAAFNETLRLTEGKHHNARYQLAICLSRLGRLEEALSHFLLLVKINPKKFEWQMDMGILLGEMGRLGEAAACFERAMKINPNAREPYSGMGTIRQRQERYAEAAEFYKRALSIEPNLFEDRANLALCLIHLHRRREALANLKVLLRLGPNSPLAHHAVAYCLLRADMPVEAVKHLQRALALDPNLTRAMGDLAWVRAAHPEASLRDGVEAVKLAKKAVELNSDDPGLLASLAAAYAEMGLFNQARQTAATALEKAAPDSKLAKSIEEMLKILDRRQPVRQPYFP